MRIIAKPVFHLLSPAVMERFWRQVDWDSDGCWTWKGSTSFGYGRFYIENGGYAAHRVSYCWHHQREIGVALSLDHLCRNRSCVNPEHLEECTVVENVSRSEAFSAVNARKTHCPKGHPLVEGNLRSSVSAEGRRGCLTCHREDAKRSNVKRQAIIDADPELRAQQLADKKHRNKERREAVSAAAKHLGMGYKEYIAEYGENRERALAFLNAR